MPAYCVVHSLPDRVALCPFPDSGASSCHQCGAPIRAAAHGHAYAIERDVKCIAMFCGNVCEDIWNRDHSGYFDVPG